jgi:hypothetical protein
VGSGATSYLKFNLGGVPAGSTVNKATLRLYVDAVISAGQFDVYDLPSSPAWTERGLKFSSPPPPLGSSATGGNPISVTAASVNNFLLIDLTATVQGWLADPASNNGLALFTRSVLPYVTPDINLTQVAAGWSQLASANHTNGITFSAAGTTVPTIAWTGTTPAGGPDVSNNGDNCLGWQQSNTSGNYGDTSAIDATWTQGQNNFRACGNPAALICVQQ